MKNNSHNRIAIHTSPCEFGIVNRRNSVTTNCEYLFQNKKISNPDIFKGNIENFIGLTVIPTGIIGPVKVNGTMAKGNFYVPMATSEGALVASYHRGAKACYEAGGATSICIEESVQRSPTFKFDTVIQLTKFLAWVLSNTEMLKQLVSQKSRFAQLKNIISTIEGNHLILTFEYYTGDASGQNMVTFCTQHICEYIVNHCPFKPVFWFIEGNYSGDKKATTRSFAQTRGKKVTTEIVLPKAVIEKTLKTTAKSMFNYWLTSTMGVIQSGAIGAQGHYANGLSAIFLATGQDVACVSESSVGITRMEALPNGDLYACVTLPNLIVGTVGGGTGLPTQKECLQIMNCYGEGKSQQYAEIVGAVLLAGELSIAAALSAGHFTNAHQTLGRKTINK